MRWLSVSLAGLLALGVSTWSAAGQDPPGTPEEQLAAIQADYQKAQSDFFELYQKAKTDEERTKLVQDHYPQPEGYAVRFMDLAKAHPKTETAFQALTWIVTQGQGGTSVADEAIDALIADHADNPQLGQICYSMMYAINDSGERFLEGAMESPHREVQGIATYCLAMLKKNRSEYGASPDDAPKLAEESEKLLEKVVAEFGDVQGYQGSLADMAERDLFEVRHLAIGKTAPEIVGQDIDGVEFKLSDYRGRVVVLDFWGSW
jgi:hypothetical protein